MFVDRIKGDLTAAMKARDELRTSVLRMISSAVKNRRIELMHDLGDDEAMAVVRTLVKQYRDALEDFRRGGRSDLAGKTEREIEILNGYLPAGPSDETVREVVRQKIADLGATGAKDFGKVMGAAMKELGGAASGDEVSKVVRELLG
ncbi:GatB/YqeY domain-containing protein [Candidatus Uhrbacteria bacterium]|nr:GatB/YqeY domain-containing protein [Candidatus Uhrbacteria bacterium]